MGKIIYPDLSYTLCGILFDVHNELGRYNNEKQYYDLIGSSLNKKNIRFEREKILPISFEGEVKGRNIIDFLVEDTIVLEIKAKRILEREDYYQVQRYLKALNKKLGILVNFRTRYLQPKRILNSSSKI